MNNFNQYSGVQVLHRINGYSPILLELPVLWKLSIVTKLFHELPSILVASLSHTTLELTGIAEKVIREFGVRKVNIQYSVIKKVNLLKYANYPSPEKEPRTVWIDKIRLYSGTKL